MGRRSQPRVQGILPVRISGIDHEGHTFTEHVCTMEISARGSRLAGVRARLCVGDTLQIGYRNRTARFRVKWLAIASRAPREAYVGLECLDPNAKLWPIRLPGESMDHYEGSAMLYEDARRSSARRRYVRFGVSGTACISKIGGSQGIWVRLSNISLSGCHLETDEPLNSGHRTMLFIRVADIEFEAKGVVRSSDPRSGVGIEFTYMSAGDRRKLTRLIAQLEQADAVRR